MSASRVHPCVNANTANDVVMEQLAVFSTQRSASTDLFSRNREAQTIETLRNQHAAIWSLTHAARYAELASILGPLIAGLEAAVNADACGDQLSEVRGMLVDAYQATSAMMAKLGATDAAWIAADRAASIAESLGDPLALAASLFRMAHAFLGVGAIDEVRRVAHRAIDILEDRVKADHEPEVRSLHGALQLVLAIAEARQKRRAEMYRHLERACEIANQLGEDRNDYDTEFGPTNVGIHTVAVAVELGDVDYAIQLSSEINTNGLSPERQARYLIDLAAAYDARLQVDESLNCLEAAEQLTPE